MLEGGGTLMAVPERDYSGIESERLSLIKLMEQIDAEAGVPLEPVMTIEELRESQLARGILPEDNVASTELMRMRYGDDWETD
jgi:hypothetical protein